MANCLITPSMILGDFSSLMGESNECCVVRYYDIGSDEFKMLWWADGLGVHGRSFKHQDLALSMDDFCDKFIQPIVQQFKSGLAERMPRSVVEKYTAHVCPSFYCSNRKEHHG
jgi:hypothetical protein